MEWSRVFFGELIKFLDDWPLFGYIEDHVYDPKSIILMPQVPKIVWSNPFLEWITLFTHQFFMGLWFLFSSIVWKIFSDINVTHNSFQLTITWYCLVVGCSERRMIENLTSRNSSVIITYIFREVVVVGITSNHMLTIF